MKSAISSIALAFTFVLVAAVSAQENPWPQDNDTETSTLVSPSHIGADLAAAIRIMSRLCFGNINDTVAADVWSCYNVTGDGSVFEECQMGVFGFVWNTSDNMKRMCRGFFKLPTYAKCVKTGFQNAGFTNLEMNTIGESVLHCEADVFGIEAGSNGNGTDSSEIGKSIASDESNENENGNNNDNDNQLSV